MVDKSPDAAKTRGEAAANKAAKATEKQRALEIKHRDDLKRYFGEVGSVGGQYSLGVDQNNDYVLFENIYDEKDKTKLIDKVEVFFWVDPDGITFRTYYGSGLIKSVKENYKGNLDTLRKQLFDKNFMSETDYLTKDETALSRAIIRAGRSYTLSEVQKYTVEGQTKFSPFNKWLTGLGSARAGGGEDLPVRDINLMDRDVVEAIVRGVYTQTTDMSPEDADAFIQQETDRYVKQIKEGTLTTVKKVGGEMVRKTTKPFSEAQVRAELPGRIKEEMPGITNYKTNFDFLAFMNSLGAEVVQ